MGWAAGTAKMMCMLLLSRQSEEAERAWEGDVEIAPGGAGSGASMDVLLEEAVLAAREEAEDGA